MNKNTIMNLINRAKQLIKRQRSSLTTVNRAKRIINNRAKRIRAKRIINNRAKRIINKQ